MMSRVSKTTVKEEAEPGQSFPGHFSKALAKFLRILPQSSDIITLLACFPISEIEFYNVLLP